MEKPKIGIIGCGSISGNYLTSAKKAYSDIFEISAVSDIDINRAKKRAEEFEIRKVLTTEEMLKDDEIELVVNLTIPGAHHNITKSFLQAGKHVFSEKPFGINRTETADILETAKKYNKKVGCAPEIFLSMQVQSVIKCVQSGYIGNVIGAHCVCFHPTHGNENWHPEPLSYYQKGAGPMFDMGGYYFSALIAINGPVESVMSYETMNFPERTIITNPHRGEIIKVEVPTHVVGMFQFKSGAVGTFINTLDAWNTKQPYIELYGTEGTIILPHPGRFEGEALLSRFAYGENEWVKVPSLMEYKNTARGIGIVDMLEAISNDRSPRASGEFAAHVMDIIIAFDEASADKKMIKLASTCIPPNPRWVPYNAKDKALK